MSAIISNRGISHWGISNLGISNLGISIVGRAVKRRPARFAIAIVWLVFTLSLLGWWIYFGAHQVDRLAQTGYPDAPELVRFQRMLMWEGGTLIALIIAGGLSGLYLLARELQTQGEIRAFFAAFTHEMRTSLSSLLLKTEALSHGSSNPGEAQPIVTEIERIRLQLDNALFATVSAEGGLHRESLALIDIVRRVAERFTELSVATVGEVSAHVICDARALESMLSNLFSNALIHGQAGGVTVDVRRSGANNIELRITDDGLGFAGDRAQIGRRFVRHYEGSGTGLGLSITTELVQRSGGSFRWELGDDNRFLAILTIPCEVGA